MAGKKTRDGIRINDIVSVAQEVSGITIRPGTNHPYVLKAPNMMPCPLATTTDARRMVAPWLSQYTGKTSMECYDALRQGSWS
jgi:hypothetical protein